jgi:hypothetical protein
MIGIICLGIFTMTRPRKENNGIRAVCAKGKIRHEKYPNATSQNYFLCLKVHLRKSLNDICRGPFDFQFLQRFESLVECRVCDKGIIDGDIDFNRCCKPSGVVPNEKFGAICLTSAAVGKPGPTLTTTERGTLSW